MLELRFLMAGAIAACIGVAHAQVISNGGFETGKEKVIDNQWLGNVIADGWTFNCNSGIANGDSAWGRSAHSGRQYAYIQSADHGVGIFTQVVDGFTVGRRYEVVFWMARRNTAVPGITSANIGAPVELMADNFVIVPFTTPASDGSWTMYRSRPFVAKSQGIAFTFMAKTCPRDQASLIDDVALVPLSRGVVR